MNLLPAHCAACNRWHWLPATCVTPTTYTTTTSASAINLLVATSANPPPAEPGGVLARVGR